MTHGYYYDKDNARAAWLDDTWTMETKVPQTWTRMQVQGGEVPEARYGHTAALHPKSREIFVYGGTDGGARYNGGRTFEFGNEFGDVWKLDVAARRWTLVRGFGANAAGVGEEEGVDEPFRRYHHGAAVLDNAMYVFGGLTHAPSNGHFWKLDLGTATWSQLDLPTQARKAPEPRMGHIMAPLSPVPSSTFAPPRTYFIVSMGKSIKGAAGSLPMADTWIYEAHEGSWKALYPSTSNPSSEDSLPLARIYGAGAVVHLGGYDHLVIAGGSTTTGMMTCSVEAWAGRILPEKGEIAWRRLPDLPFGVYQHSMAAVGTTVYLFGGHLCAEKDGGIDFQDYYSNAVLTLELSKVGDLWN